MDTSNPKQSYQPDVCSYAMSCEAILRQQGTMRFFRDEDPLIQSSCASKFPLRRIRFTQAVPVSPLDQTPVQNQEFASSLLLVHVRLKC